MIEMRIRNRYWLRRSGLHQAQFDTPYAFCDIEPSPRQAAGNVLPVRSVLRSTAWMIVYFQFAREPRCKRWEVRSLSWFNATRQAISVAAVRIRQPLQAA